MTYPGYNKIFNILRFSTKICNKIETFMKFLDCLEFFLLDFFGNFQKKTYVFSIFEIYGYAILQLRSKMKPTNLMYPGFTHRV